MSLRARSLLQLRNSPQDSSTPAFAFADVCKCLLMVMSAGEKNAKKRCRVI